MGTLASSKVSDEITQNVAFHQDLYFFLLKTKMIFREKNAI